MADNSGDPTGVLPALGLPILAGSWGGPRTTFLTCSAISHVPFNRRNGMTIDYPQYYSVWVIVTLGEERLSSIDHLTLPPSKSIWCHRHILLSKYFDPEGIIWIFSTSWVINGPDWFLHADHPSPFAGQNWDFPHASWALPGVDRHACIDYSACMLY